MSRTRRKNNQISGQFVAHSRELRESAAWRALPDNARRILDRLEVEHMRHGGAENGALPCTYSDFVAAGVRRASVSLAIRQCAALGFLEVTHRGGRSNAEYRNPSRSRRQRAARGSRDGEGSSVKAQKPSGSDLAASVPPRDREAGCLVLTAARIESETLARRGDPLQAIDLNTAKRMRQRAEADAPGYMAEVGTGSELIPASIMGENSRALELADTVRDPNYITVDASRDRLELANEAGALERDEFTFVRTRRE